jgi:uncharacterized membrane protein
VRAKVTFGKSTFPHTMRSIKILNLILATGLVGIMLGIWIGFNPSSLSASAYVSRQQAMIRALNTPMPALGAATILLALVGAFLRRANTVQTLSLLAAAALLVGSGIITRFCNQPINVVVMTWNASAPPGNWTLLRDQWWTWHIVRTLLATAALVVMFFGYRRLAGSITARENGA